jgi:hypothetical protein
MKTNNEVLQFLIEENAKYEEKACFVVWRLFGRKEQRFPPVMEKHNAEYLVRKLNELGIAAEVRLADEIIKRIWEGDPPDA